MASPTASVDPAHALPHTKPLTARERQRLLRTPLGVSLLGTTPCLDVFTRNPYRVLGVSAGAAEAEVEGARQRFRNLLKLDSHAALSEAVDLGYDGALGVDDALESIDRLGNPASRLSCQILWPLLNGAAFGAIRTAGSLVTEQARAALEAGAARESAGLRAQARAIAWLNAALAAEFDFGCGGGAPTAELWRQGLAAWQQLIESKEFWSQIRARVQALDHPLLKPAVVDGLPHALAELVLGFNAVLAREYLKAGQVNACRLHLQLITRSQMPERAKQRVLGDVVQALVDARLAGPLRDARDLKGCKRMPWSEFTGLCEPILAAAREVQSSVLGELGVEAELLPTRPFDTLADTLMQAVNNVIDYSGDTRLRALLCSCITMKHVLALPLSPAMRARVVNNVRQDAKHMYGDFLPRVDFDPTACWFLDGAEADPASSLEYPVYKITKSTCTGVTYNHPRILVPRSKAAAAAHGKGKLDLADLSAVPGSGELAELRARLTAARRDRELEERRLDAAQAEELAAAGQVRQSALAKVKALSPAERKACEKAIQDAERTRDRRMAAATAGSEDRQRQARAQLERDIQAVPSKLGGPPRGLFGFLQAWKIGRHRKSLRQAHAGRRAELHAQLLAEQARLREECARTVAEQEARLQGVEDQKRQIELQHTAQTTAIKQRHAATKAAGMKTADQAVTQLERKLREKLKVEPLEAYRRYLPYERAKSQSYRDGTEPGQAEIGQHTGPNVQSVINSLDQQGRMLLQMKMRTMSDERGGELFNRLLELPPGQRGSYLRSL